MIETSQATDLLDEFGTRTTALERTSIGSFCGTRIAMLVREQPRLYPELADIAPAGA
jgi:hypothetical protein